MLFFVFSLIHNYLFSIPLVFRLFYNVTNYSGIKEIIQYVIFWDCVFTPCLLWDSLKSLWKRVVHSFLLLGIPFCLYSYLLKDTWVISSFWVIISRAAISICVQIFLLVQVHAFFFSSPPPLFSSLPTSPSSFLFPPSLVCFSSCYVLVLRHGAMHMLDKCSTTELCP